MWNTNNDFDISSEVLKKIEIQQNNAPVDFYFSSQIYRRQ